MKATDLLHRDVTISPFYTPFAYWKEPTFIGASSLQNNYLTHLAWGRSVSLYAFKRTHTHVIEKPCILGQFILPSWGHFIIESLNNLYMIKKLDKDYPLIYLSAPYGNQKLPNYQKELLALLGLNQDVFVLNDTVLFKNIYISPPGISINGHQLKEQIAALGIIESRPIPGKKIYISRSKIKKGSCLNERAVEKLLAERGWTVIHPEELPVREQLEHFATAEIIFAISGSALHSLLLLKDVPQRVVVYPRIHTHTYNQVARAKCHDYWLLDVPHKCVKPNRDSSQEDYLLDLEFLEQTLEKSGDFNRLKPIRERIKRPDEPDADFQSLPTIYESARGMASVKDNLFYRVLFALANRKALTNGLKIIRTLLQKQMLEEYMLPVCQQFLDRFYPESAKLFRGIGRALCEKKLDHAIQQRRDACLAVMHKEAGADPHHMENRQPIPPLIKLS